MKIFTLTAVLMLGFGFVFTAAADWNVGIGGNSGRNCQSSDAGPLSETVLWQDGPFTHFCRQAAADEEVYVVCRTFDSGDLLHGTLLYALDVTTGEELWNIDLPVPFPAEDYRIQLMGINNGRVYATRAGNTHGSYLYALSAEDGSILWQSADLIKANGFEGLAFAPNGDPVVGNWSNITRINGSDGTTVWSSPRTQQCSDGGGVSIYENRVYSFQATAGTGPIVRVMTLDNGTFLYDGPLIAPGYSQQLGLLVGPDGTVYAPRINGNPLCDYMVSYTDTGTELVENWRSELPYLPFSTFAVGIDSTLYSCDRELHIVRLDPATGDKIDTSPEVLTENSNYTRFAVDSSGILYAVVASWPDGPLYSFNPDLTVRWSVDFPEIGSSGPVLAEGGILIIAGDQTDIVAYYTGTGLEDEEYSGDGSTLSLDIVNPIASTAAMMLKGNSEQAELQIFDYSGRLVLQPWTGPLNGTETVICDLSDLATGAYMVRLSAGGAVASGSFVILR